MALVLLLSLQAAAADRDGIEFFEKRIRPVLVEHCHSCHSAQAKKVKGDLLLDTREGLLKGGASGPSIVPGRPEKSLLLKAIRHVDENLAMPKEKLPDEVIADVEAWIRRGAPDPRGAGPAAAASAGNPREFWSLKPVRALGAPAVKAGDWVRTPVDAFILAKLEERGLPPSPPADPRALLRRAAYDLTGLPPEPEDLEAFLKDPSPEAFDRAVDRLLDSPAFGERWARHWLDVARYADTKGDVDREEPRYPYAYTYRDWVVRAFNEDLPLDRFIVYQIAADQVKDLEPRHRAAMGFLTVGRRFRNNVHDVIDDRIDVVGRGLLGLTIGCARCHDHKHDPIPTKDYYSLYGVFASSAEPKEYPLLGEPAESPEYAAYVKERDARQKKVDDLRAKVHARILESWRSAEQIKRHLLIAHEARGVDAGKLRDAVGSKGFNETAVRRWIDWLKAKAAAPDAVWAPWTAFAALDPKAFAERSAAVAEELSARKDLHPEVAKAFAVPPRSLEEVAERYGRLLGEKGPEDLRALLRAERAPPSVSIDQLERIYEPKDRDDLVKLRKALDELAISHPGAPPRAMVMEDKASPVQPRVFIRGNSATPGPAVPRRFLEVLSPPDRPAFSKGSGRLELALAIARPDNPLTARVLANRAWHHVFGRGLVATPSDFGAHGERPTHPELLDALAAGLVRDGWSLKALLRVLLRSSTYRQDSADRPDGRAADPDNELLWRMNRRRLDLEAMRDSILRVSERLDRRLGGRPVDLLKAPFPGRRTIYGVVDRQNLPGMFTSFDFASPDMSSPKRFQTTVPQQALFLMNSDLVSEHVRHLAALSDVAGAPSPEARVQSLYRRVFGREASAEEIGLGAAFLKGAEPPSKGTGARPMGLLEEYAQALLLTNEFAFVD